jgi:hypothetical protein
VEDRIAEYFTGIEAEKRKALVALMDEWRTAVAPALTYLALPVKWWKGPCSNSPDGTGWRS